jgi:hypothetical protein
MVRDMLDENLGRMERERVKYPEPMELTATEPSGRQRALTGRV